MSQATPQVSIITATYNRSNVLAYAIRSVLWSTFPDWELIVVGDACTDDTEEVVASFDDPRIRFMNLERNFGEQSGPNNEGYRHARGRYIAYLNHDDLWLPDHLETALGGIEETGADLVFTLVSRGLSDGARRLVGATSTGCYEPHMNVPASSWLMCRELMEEIGPWKFYRDCYTTPSVDWLFRARKAGKDLRLIPWMTIVSISSIYTPGTYATRDFRENERYYERIAQEPDFREREMTELCLRHAAESRDPNLEALRWFRRGFYHLFLRMCDAFRVHPTAVRSFLRNHQKGALIDRLRHIRGLEPLRRGRRTRA